MNRRIRFFKSEARSNNQTKKIEENQKPECFRRNWRTSDMHLISFKMHGNGFFVKHVGNPLTVGFTTQRIFAIVN